MSSMLAQSVSLIALPCLLSAAAGAQGFVALTAPLGVPSVPHSTTDNGAGVAVADFDGDGDLDLVVAPASGQAFAMFRNDGGMHFTDVSAASGLGTLTVPRCVVVADVDNDGDQDLFVGRHLQPPRLFVNDGAGHFTDQAVARGLVGADDTYAATFGDYDRDGWLDLYLGNHFNAAGSGPAANRLYHNLGNGVFADVTVGAGLTTVRATQAAAFFDFDEDGWPDLLEVNDRGTVFGANELWRNDGDGTFSPVAAQYGAAAAIDGMGIDFVDVFNDGGVDFFCTDDPVDHLFQLWNPGSGSYTNATATYGLQGGATGWACNFLDYDNDGWQDLHVVHQTFPNFMLRNPGAAAAAQVPWPNTTGALGLGLLYPQFTAAIGDFDDDGRLDIVQRFSSASTPPAPVGLALYRNQVAAGNWLRFRTEGTVGNRDGLGARIEVQTGTRRQRQWVRSGVGYVSSSDRRVHFGLGTAASADRVTVTWPSGQRQYLTNVPANQTVLLREPRLTVAGPVPVGGSTTLTASLPGDHGLDYLMVMALSANVGIPLPDGAVIPIDYDILTAATLGPNVLLPGSVGVLDANGAASSAVNIPPFPFLSGWTLYATILTLDQPAFPYARTVMAKALPVPIL